MRFGDLYGRCHPVELDYSGYRSPQFTTVSAGSLVLQLTITERSVILFSVGPEVITGGVVSGSSSVVNSKLSVVGPFNTRSVIAMSAL